jgi:hypothetical protein
MESIFYTNDLKAQSSEGEYYLKIDFKYPINFCDL